MADIATLGMRVDTRQVKGATKDLNDLTKAGKNAEKATGGISKGFGSIGDAIGGLRASAGGLAGILSVTAIAGVVAQYASLTDEYTKLTAQLRIATDSQIEFNTAMEDVQRISATAQSDVSAVSVLYGRLNMAMKEAYISQREVASVTEAVTLALKVNGSGAAESAAAMLQLSQAFGSGRLAGDEFRTLLEAAPPLMRQLAASLGVPIGALKSLAAEGVLTSDKLTKAWSDPAYVAKLREQAKTIQTVSGAFQQLKNEALITIGEIDKKAGASRFFSGIVGGLGTAIREAGGRGGKTTVQAPSAEDRLFQGLRNNPLSRQTLQIGGTRQDVQRQTETFTRLSDGLRITSVELENIKRKEAEARKEFNAGNITLTQYHQILEGLTAERKGLQKSSPADKLKDESRYAEELANDMANLIQQFEDAARPSETLSQELERQLAAYSSIDPAVKRYLQTLLDKVKADELAAIQAEALADSQEHLQQTLENDEGLKAWRDLKDEAERLYEQTRTPLEQFEAKILDIKKMLDNGLINPDTAGRASADAYKQFVEDNKQAADQITEFWKEAARNMQDAMADGFFDLMQGNLGDLEQTFKRTIDRMVANLMASQLNDFLFGDMAKDGNIGGKVGELFGSMGNFFGGLFAGGGDPPLGKVSVVGEKGPELFVPKSAGTIIPNNKINQGNTTVSVTVYANDAGSFKRSESQIAAQMQRALNKAQRVT